MFRYRFGNLVIVLVALTGPGLLCLAVPLFADTGTPSGVGGTGGLPNPFDREALQRELSQPLGVLQTHSTEALRTYVKRLADLQFAMDLAVDISSEERRILGEQIVARMGQVALLIRQREVEPSGPGRARGFPTADPGPTPSGDLVSMLIENSGLLLRLLGGLVVAFCVGNLVGRRYAGRQASSHGKSVSSRTRSGRLPGETWPIRPEDIREGVAAGRTILLQAGYEIAPTDRDRFLKLAGEIGEALHRTPGQSYTVWEDSVRPNRFYALLECREVEVLAQLTARDGPLASQWQALEGCRRPGGFTIRRAWWGISSAGHVHPPVTPLGPG